MQTRNTELLILAARAYAGDRLADAVSASTEVRVVVPSVLRQKLLDAGYEVIVGNAPHGDLGFRPLQNLVRVSVTDDGAVVAFGASVDEQDALLHAALGYVRERDLEQFGEVLTLEVRRLPDPMNQIKGLRIKGADAPRELVEKIKQHLAAAAKPPR